MKICHMHFALRKSCFIYVVYSAVCLQAKPSSYMATAVIIWMLWCTSTARVPRECARSLNTLSRWHLKCTVWIWILDSALHALHLQTVGFHARKLSGDCSANHTQCLNRGTNVKKRITWIKTPLCVFLIYTTCIKLSCLLLIYSCYLGVGETCNTNKSHWYPCELVPQGG